MKAYFAALAHVGKNKCAVLVPTSRPEERGYFACRKPKVGTVGVDPALPVCKDHGTVEVLPTPPTMTVQPKGFGHIRWFPEGGPR